MMSSVFAKVIVPMLLACSAITAFAQPFGVVTPDMVLQSAAKHSPQVLAALEKQEQAQGQITEAEGAFDATIEQDSLSYGGGFYNGRSVDTQLVKPLPRFNSRIFTGYRVSGGEFPVYQDEYVTNDNGEFSVGIAFSLLRNRDIDPNRLALANAKIGDAITQAEVALVRLQVQQQALVRYWDWLAAGYIQDVYEELLRIALERQEAFEVRAARGDLAQIFLTENRQLILRREAQLNDAERAFRLRANALSIFLRNDEGEPRIVDEDELPTGFPPRPVIRDEARLQEGLAQRPEIIQIEQELEQISNKLAFSKNLRLPKADLEMKYSDDGGMGDESRADAEAVFKVDVSIPLQQRRADGQIRRLEAERRELRHNQRLMQDQMRAELDNALVNLDTAKRYIELTAEEIELARKMRAAEKTRFENGDSDYFLVIQRDENLATAQIKNIQAQADYHKFLAQLYALSMNQQALGL